MMAKNDAVAKRMSANTPESVGVDAEGWKHVLTVIVTK